MKKKWRKAESSPIRVSKVSGVWFFEISGGYKVEGDDHHYSGFAGEGRTYQEAKRNFWIEWKEMWPDVYLNPRLSQ